MATQETLIRADATAFMFTHAADYSAQTNGVIDPGSSTAVEIDVDEGVTTGLAEESAAVDLGVDHAESYEVITTYQLEDDPTAGDTLDFYWSSSHASGAVGNLGFAGGAAGAFAGTSGMTLAETLKHLIFIGSAVVGINNNVDANDGLQIAMVGVFNPGPQQYGTLIVHNNTSVTMEDSIEFAVRMRPIISDLQAAA